MLGYKSIKRGGMICIIVIIIRNRIVELSSKPGQDCLHFSSANVIGKVMNSSVLFLLHLVANSRVF